MRDTIIPVIGMSAMIAAYVSVVNSNDDPEIFIDRNNAQHEVDDYYIPSGILRFDTDHVTLRELPNTEYERTELVGGLVRLDGDFCYKIDKTDHTFDPTTENKDDFYFLSLSECIEDSFTNYNTDIRPGFVVYKPSE